jgi:lipid-A-disaccharide synthase
MTTLDPDADAAGPLFYIIAGEASGDVLGAGLMRGLRTLTQGRARFAGVGGDRMAEEGLASLFPISEMAVMGVFEILPHARHLLGRVRETVEDVARLQPAALITIDSKAFTMRVARRLRKRREAGSPVIPLIHMVAPTVWAWRPGRAKVISRFLDHLLVLFPFEPPYFERHGLATTFIGHPAVDQPDGDGRAFRGRFAIPDDATVIAVLPGSRPGEVKRLLPVFGRTVERLRTRYPKLHAVIPTVSVVADQVEAGVADWKTPVTVVRDARYKADAFAAADVALATSGTVTLELSLAKVPAVVAYRVNPLTVPIGHLLVNRDSVILTNRILERQILPLFIQSECTPERLGLAVTRLLDDKTARAEQIAAADEVRRLLRAADEPASITAARAVLRAIGMAVEGDEG